MSKPTCPFLCCQCHSDAPSDSQQSLRLMARLETVQFQARGPFKSRKCLDPFPSSGISGAFVAIADDHCPNEYQKNVPWWLVADDRTQRQCKRRKRIHS